MADLRDHLLGGFSFDEADLRRQQETKERKTRYAARFQARTPNQIVLGDGRLVEADSPLSTQKF